MFLSYIYVSFHSLILINGIRVVFSLLISQCMSPTRSGYKALGLKLIEPLKDHPR